MHEEISNNDDNKTYSNDRKQK